MLRLHSSLRDRDPSQTLQAAERCRRALGITRVTDVTRMDRLGLPVCVSVRPRGQVLCVHAGKGVLPIEARVGAVMEAIEFAVAEPHRTPWTGLDLSLAELQAHWGEAFQLFDLAPRRDAQMWPGRALRCIATEDVATGSPFWLPAELVFQPFEDPHGAAIFGCSSNGLASGNSVAEATLHGVLEVLERDVLAMNLVHRDSRWVEPCTLPHPFDGWARDWADIGVELSVRFVPNEFGLPCFSALLHDGQGQTVDLAAGSGLHLDAHVALTRAVCEAAQSRLSFVHGGRDDVTTFFDRALRRRGRDTPAYQAAFDRSRVVDWKDVPSALPPSSSTVEVLDRLLGRLTSCGMPRALRHVFAIELGGLHVVKVVVPGCQEVDVPLDRFGRRLLERAKTQARADA